MAEIAKCYFHLTKCYFSLPVFGTEWSRVAIRLILSTRRFVRAWTGHCNEGNSSQIDDNDDDEYDDDGAYDDDDDKDNDEYNDNNSSDENGDDGDNDDDDDIDDHDDDHHVSFVCLLTCLTGVPWVRWFTFAGTCVVVQFSTIVAHFATTVYNIINPLRSVPKLRRRPVYLFVDSERLSSRSSFQLEDGFLDTSEP